MDYSRYHGQRRNSQAAPPPLNIGTVVVVTMPLLSRIWKAQDELLRKT